MLIAGSRPLVGRREEGWNMAIDIDLNGQSIIKKQIIIIVIVIEIGILQFYLNLLLNV